MAPWPARSIVTRRALWGAGLLAAVLALGACDDSKKTPPPPPPPAVTVAKPLVKEIVERDDYTGRFEAADAVEVRARVGGYLEAVKFTDGAAVKKGDLLFIIDQRPYKAALAQAEANVTAARTTLDLAKLELERAEKLIQTGYTSRQNLDTRRQQFGSATAQLEAAKAAADQARLNLTYTAIHAPIAGKISRKRVTEGNLVAADTTLLTTIVSLDPIYLYFDVDEQSYLAYLRMARERNPKAQSMVNEAVSVVLPNDKGGATRVGRIDFVDNRIDPGTGTMRLRAVFSNKDQFLVPGVFGRIEMPGSPAYQAVLIPDEAIISDQDRRIVLVVAEDGTVAPRLIRPGPRADGYRIVRDGLKGDESVIVNGIQRARPGAKVTPEMTTLPPERAAASAP